MIAIKMLCLIACPEFALSGSLVSFLTRTLMTPHEHVTALRIAYCVAGKN